MTEKILITGGAGFIGSFLTDEFLSAGLKVRIMDNLDPQVHGPAADWPPYLDSRAELVRGDVRSRADWEKALDGVDYVSHHAAAVGVGQSMYEIEHYMSVNTQGTALLLDILAKEKHKVKKLMVASSMSNYGEGSCRCPEHGLVFPLPRDREQLLARQWEMLCPICGVEVEPAPTAEDKPLQPTSYYSLSKMDQELMVLLFGRTYKLPVTALRYFNVYGPRQALSNPYTGVAAIFSSRLLNNNQPLIFEDGLQSRDFIHVTDIARANRLALESHEADGEVFNVGSGRPLTVRYMAEALADHLGLAIKPEIAGQFREGDIRHCHADISKIKEKLGFEAEVKFEQGVGDLVDWVRKQEADDRLGEAKKALEDHGLCW